MPNRPTYGELAFGSFGVPPGSTYRMPQQIIGYRRTCMGGRYSEFMDTVPLMLSRILDMVRPQECLLGLLEG
jgi:hypothetical protein